jgi:hypothetical protein
MVHLDFTWISPGFHVELDNNLAGLPAKKFHLESMGEGKVLQKF